jgi:hypothetical protein
MRQPPPPPLPSPYFHPHTVRGFWRQHSFPQPRNVCSAWLSVCSQLHTRLVNLAQLRSQFGFHPEMFGGMRSAPADSGRQLRHHSPRVGHLSACCSPDPALSESAGYPLCHSCLEDSLSSRFGQAYSDLFLLDKNSRCVLSILFL